MTRPLRVLLVEDSPDDAALVLREIRRGNYEPECLRVETREDFVAALSAREWDVIVSDYGLPRYSGLLALQDARASGKDLPFILVSGTIGESAAVELMRAGAHDYLLKDQLVRLPAAIEREVADARLRAEQRHLREQLLISERMASAGLIAAAVAHEINSPLAVVVANLDFLVASLRDATPPAEMESPLVDAREAARRIREIVHDVQLFSRPREDTAAADLRAVIESALRMAHNDLRHRARVVKSYGETRGVAANPARLGQVILNLLINAGQAIPEGRTRDNVIGIATSGDGERVTIEISDTGVGIPPEHLARIWEPFFSTKPVGSGTGLGLAISHRIVQDLGGTISVDSLPGKGTTFRLVFPAAPSPYAPPPSSAVPRSPKWRARILVIDDEAAVCRSVQRILGRHHQVTALTDGREALQRIGAGERFDLILSDLMMPDVTGMDIYASLSESTPEQAERMVFVSGGAFTDRAREFLQSVPNARLDKPFAMKELLELIDSRQP